MAVTMHVLRLQDMTAARLAEAADENLVTHMTWIHQWTSGMAVHADAQLVIADSGFCCDTFNVICRARLSQQAVTERIADAISHFRTSRCPFSWWVGPADVPTDLGTALAAAGLVASETEEAMAADLDALGTFAAPYHLRIERVRTLEQLRNFAAIVATNWNPPDALVLTFYERAAPALLAADTPLWLYIGYFEDQPVATSEVTVDGGVAGLYNICTREAYRRRGIGSALTLRPLIDAREAGFQCAFLQASAEGARVYARLGFKTTGHITEYKPAVP